MERDFKKEILINISNILIKWDLDKIANDAALDEIYEQMQIYSEWEDMKLRENLFKKETYTVKGKLSYGGKLLPNDRQ